MQTYNCQNSSSIMPLLMNFTTPSPIEIAEPTKFGYCDDEQVNIEMRIVGTRSLKTHATSRKGAQSPDKKNEIDDSRSVR